MNLAQLQSALNKEFQEPMRDLIVRSRPLLSAMPKRSMATDRIWLRNQNASTHNPRAIADGSVVTVGTPGTVYGNGVLDWTTYIAEFKVSKRLLGQLVGNPALIGQLFSNEIKNATLDLADQIAGDLFKGETDYSGSPGITGLKAVMDTGNTYAGINRATVGNEYWRAGKLSASPDATNPGSLSTSLFYDAELDYYTRTKKEIWNLNPVIFTDKAIQLMYKELFETLDYGSLSTAHFVNQANSGNSFGKMGVGFLGAPILPEPNIDATGDIADTSRIYILNPASMFLASLSPNDDPEVVRMQQMDPRNAPESDGLSIDIEILGNQGEYVAGYVKTYVQLVCDNPRESGVVITDVSNAF